MMRKKNTSLYFEEKTYRETFTLINCAGILILLWNDTVASAKLFLNGFANIGHK